MSLEEPKAVTFIPYTGKFYVGAIEEGMNVQGKAEKNYEPIAILHPEELKKGNRQGAVEYTNHEMLRNAERHARGESSSVQAAVDVTSLANITRVELLTEIINRQYKDVFLINAVRKINVPKLKLDYDVILHIKTRGKNALVPKRQEPDVEAPEFVQASFDMVKFGKLARIIDTTDEDELSALISPMQSALDDIAQVLSQDENLIIRDEMLNFGDVAGSSWSAKNAGNDFSLNNPLDQISIEIERIVQNHGRPNIIATNIRTFGRYLSNTHLIGYTNALERDAQGVGTMPGFPGFTRITDTDLADGFAFIFDQRALSHGIGPMVSESFRDPKAGVSGHIVRKWIETVIPTTLRTAFGTELTTLA